MRKQIAAANWKMNLTITEAETLLYSIVDASIAISENQKVVFAVPATYLVLAAKKVEAQKNMFIAAQNIYSKKSGAFTGETSVLMLKSIGVDHAIIGHSERREYFNESNEFLAEKVKLCLQENIVPIFCCGEALPVRETNQQNQFVQTQLQESLFDLSAEEIEQVVIAYEPIWAIGTGRTASSDQAQEMHAYIRSQLAVKYGDGVANNVSILYGGSVKASNAKEIFGKPDVDGGLVGGASLIAAEFISIIQALKS
ncbi:MAG: triose-phosphate isomerase [Bacteroidota bacterium]|nr:triose-phosphate isomerase [Bacteroidota bacterium]